MCVVTHVYAHKKHLHVHLYNTKHTLNAGVGHRYMAYYPSNPSVGNCYELVYNLIRKS